VWQAIEKVLLEDSLCQAAQGQEGGQQFTQLAALQLQSPTHQPFASPCHPEPDPHKVATPAPWERKVERAVQNFSAL
jgi:hypothetical protein